MATRRFNRGDHVSWDSEAGRVSGHITRVVASEIEFKGYTRMRAGGAAVRDRTQWRATMPNKKSSQAPGSDWPVDSRGGTRTRDPGIMSAVL